MPQEKEISIFQSASNALEIGSMINTSEKPGFILCPFTAVSSVKPYFIQADAHIKMSPEDFYNATWTGTQIWDLKDLSTSNNYFKTEEEYCKDIASAVGAIQSGKLKKVVLSRMKREGIIVNSPLQIFYKLCIKYPAAFISLVYIPGNILWITATPELLISANGDEINTVSLAGTKSVDSQDGWGVKEKIEQQVVTDYIHEILKKYCSNITVSVPTEIIAGNIKHLKTSFSATLNTSLGNLVSALHPTPAVCGIPLNTAKEFIQQTECYDRKYYAGFLGPCNIDGKTNLFVNLRCAELYSNGAKLYIGGGITKDSIPEKEWEETELKSKTLLFAFWENEAQ